MQGERNLFFDEWGLIEMRGQQRICKAQVLAVVALMLAFQPFAKSCQVVGISDKRLRPYLPDDWTDRRNKRAHKWSGDRLKAVEVDYRDLSMNVRAIMSKHSIGQSVLFKLASRHRWGARVQGRPVDPTSTRSMAPERRRYYDKLLRAGMPSATAKAAAWKAAFGNSDVSPVSPTPRDVALYVRAEPPAGSHTPPVAEPERN